MSTKSIIFIYKDFEDFIDFATVNLFQTFLSYHHFDVISRHMVLKFAYFVEL